MARGEDKKAEEMRRFTHRKGRVLRSGVLSKSKMHPIPWTRVGRPVRSISVNDIVLVRYICCFYIYTYVVLK
jgi:hypothetical protein